MRITVKSVEYKDVRIEKENRDCKACIVTYKVGKDIGKVQFLDMTLDLFDEKWKKAKKEIRKAIANDFKDWVTEIELTKEDFEETKKPENPESTP